RLSPVTRRLLNLLTPLSLLLFLAAVVLWVRSASRVEYAYVAVGTRAFGLSTYDDSLYGVYYSVSPGGTVAGGSSRRSDLHPHDATVFDFPAASFAGFSR